MKTSNTLIRIDFVIADLLYIDTDSLIGCDLSGLSLERAIFDGMCLNGARFNHTRYEKRTI
ncbi:hypothetical protein EYW98_16605 [Escherichia coli]|uniref:pentapeptide repeat-containing protein n=1 Tax=Escherichia sp. MOD1-EC7003 TaxID=2093900 RepID=UPI000CF75870|nr:hypothetical protein [Escherichia coli]EGO8378501.1 hypothetical protein [Escherichia coli]MCH0692320.1 pentapeptide repeat-containing protein [Escherichia coli]